MKSDWSVIWATALGQLRSGILMTHGEWFVEMHGALMRLLWCADSLTVEELLLPMLCLGMGTVRLRYVMLCVREMNLLLESVYTHRLNQMVVLLTVKMLELCVQV